MYPRRTINVKGDCALGRLEPGRTRVHHAYMTRVRARLRHRTKYRPTFIRAWRQKRGLTLEALASRIGTTHTTLSRIERGLQPYSQALLEAIAEALAPCTPADLLMRDPTDPDGIWSVWDHAKPAERQMIVDLAKTLTKTGTR